MRELLLLWTLWGACAYPDKATRPAHPFLRADHIEAEVLTRLPLNLDPIVTWTTCHEDTGNGYYIGHNTIILCNENAEISPEFARYVFLHELGHLAVDYYSIDVEGRDEAAADEFAVIMDILEFDGEDIPVASSFFDGLEKTYAVSDDDDHPSFAGRSEAMRCVLRGYLEPRSGCLALYLHALTTWHEALKEGLGDDP